MKTVTFTEFRRNASELLSDVEKGQVFVIIRHGKPVAELSPVSSSAHPPSWKKPALRLKIAGSGLSAAILEERGDEDIL